MTPREMSRAYNEFVPPKELGPDHWVEILESIYKTGKFTETSEELNKLMHELFGD